MEKNKNLSKRLAICDREEDVKKEIDRLASAVDVIAEYEDGDNLFLKREIRKEIEALEREEVVLLTFK